MATMLVCVGLPASGKSTWAAKKVLENAPGAVLRVNRDTIREMIHADRWKGQKTEGPTVAVRDMIIEYGLKAGKDVISDDTNLDPGVRAHLKALAERCGAEVEFINFTDVPIEECIKRDLKRHKSVGEAVIRKMYNQYLVKPAEPLEQDQGLPAAVLVDLDGTIAHMNGRSPYDYSRVGEDDIDTAILDIIIGEHGRGTKVIICSGREGTEKCRQDTITWLQKHGVPMDEFFMRPAGDMRKDSLVKREIFESKIRNKYRVLYCLDDRTQVVDAYRDLGLKVFQVAPGNF